MSTKPQTTTRPQLAKSGRDWEIYRDFMASYEFYTSNGYDTDAAAALAEQYVNSKYGFSESEHNYDE